MTLSQYLEAHEITDADFAAIAGMSQPQINRLRRGTSLPSWEAVRAIEIATNGAVTANDFAAARSAKASAA